MELKDKRLFRQQCYIDGAWVNAASGETIEVNNPSGDTLVGTMPKMSRGETAGAIEAANAAYPGWRAKTAKERAAILRKWHDLMLENSDDLATIMTTEQGKPITESRGEVVYAAAFIEWFAEEGKRIYGDIIPQHAPGKRIVVTKEP
ncbi:MAG: aldehyde dehydrogenase family protein, partial [Proteobacteria bacterium]|nr:aldehyde dehydrogenase family protein [Pseudomonadota bacterium]